MVPVRTRRSACCHRSILDQAPGAFISRSYLWGTRGRAVADDVATAFPTPQGLEGSRLGPLPPYVGDCHLRPGHAPRGRRHRSRPYDFAQSPSREQRPGHTGTVSSQDPVELLLVHAKSAIRPGPFTPASRWIHMREPRERFRGAQALPAPLPLPASPRQTRPARSLSSEHL
jgi:hypothetical protein